MTLDTHPATRERSRVAFVTGHEDPGKGEEPTRVQDPQAKAAPGVEQESGDKKDPDVPEAGRGGAPAGGAPKPRSERRGPQPLGLDDYLKQRRDDR